MPRVYMVYIEWYIPRVYRVYPSLYTQGVQGVSLPICPPYVPGYTHHPCIYTTLPLRVYPRCTLCHDCTGVRCVRGASCVREEALGSNLGIIRDNEAHRALLSPRV